MILIKIYENDMRTYSFDRPCKQPQMHYIWFAYLIDHIPKPNK